MNRLRTPGQIVGDLRLTRMPSTMGDKPLAVVSREPNRVIEGVNWVYSIWQTDVRGMVKADFEMKM